MLIIGVGMPILNNKASKELSVQIAYLTSRRILEAIKQYLIVVADNQGNIEI
jgi:hypothetical protein